MRRQERRVTRFPILQDPFAASIRALGAIAHFDPSVRATDDGTTSTWVDRISGYSVISVSAGTRLTYSSSVAGLNGRAGWAGDGTRYLRGSSIPAITSGSHTVYYVARPTSIAAVQMVCGAGSSTAQEAYGWGMLTTGAFNTRRRATAVVDSFSGVILSPANEAFVGSAVNSGGTATQWTNAGPSMAAAVYTAAPAALNLFTVGALIGYNAADTLFQPFVGSIGDIIIFPTAHTDAQRRYVEQLIAAKYGWPCIQGLSGFTTANFLYTALNGGVRGASGVGVWSDSLVRFDAIPAASQYIYSDIGSANLYGHGVQVSPAALSAHFARNGVVNTGSPTRAIAAGDLGKLKLVGGTADLSFSRQYFDGAEIGAGTALAGYEPPAADSNYRYTVGGTASGVPNSASVDQQPSVSMSVFGVAGGDVAQNTANQAARAAAVKAAGRFVATGGATPTHAWALLDDGATFADLVGSDVLTKAGTLARAQIIVPTWPW